MPYVARNLLLTEADEALQRVNRSGEDLGDLLAAGQVDIEDLCGDAYWQQEQDDGAATSEYIYHGIVPSNNSLISPAVEEMRRNHLAYVEKCRKIECGELPLVEEFEIEW